MAILKHIASKSSNYGAALEYLIFKHDEFRKTPILDQNGNCIMRDEFYLDGLNCEPYSFDAACQQLNREYQKNKNKNEIKSHAYDAAEGKGEVIKEDYFENCEWHIRALFEGERRVEESQLKCEGVGQTKVCVSYHAGVVERLSLLFSKRRKR